MDTDAKPQELADAYVGSVLGGNGRDAAAARTFQEKLPLDQVLVVPEENYRWGSKKGMEADLQRVDMREDGSLVNSFETLVENIRTLNVRDPIGVVLRPDGQYHPIYGFTRTLAAKKAGLTTIPAYVYDSSISDGEVELLQLHENAEGLRREVNWMREVEGIDDLISRFAERFPDAKNPAGRAMDAVAKLLGKAVGTLKNRKMWVAAMEREVKDLAREGRLSCSAALLLVGDGSSPVHHRHSRAFVLEILAALKMKDGTYPSSFSPDAVRTAIRNARLKSKNSIAKAEQEHRPVVDNHIRQSPSVVRDVSVMLARSLLNGNKLNLLSDASDVEALVGSSHWWEIRGMGVGAGDALVPPVLETVIGKRGEDDELVQQLEDQYERTGEAYATKTFVEAFLHNTMEGRGVHYMGNAERAGWQSGFTVVKDKKVHHRDVYREALAAALDPVEAKLLVRAKAAWKILKPLVDAYKSGG